MILLDEKMDLLDINMNKTINNISDTDKIDDCNTVKTPTMWQQVLIGVPLCVVIGLTLLGNGLVVAAICTYRHLRTVANLLILSLSCADITVAVLVMPLAMMTHIKPDLSMGWVFCYFWISCDVTCCTASLLHLCVISVDRHLAITRPYDYHQLLPRQRAIVIIIAVWLCSAAISFLPIYLGWFQSDPHKSSQCLDHIHECGLHDISRPYALVSSLTSYYIPIIVIMCAYTRIFFTARRQAAKIRRQYVHAGQRNDRLRRRSINAARDVRILRTLGVLLGAVIICWTPFFLLYIILPFCPSCSPPHYAVTAAITWLGYANSAINPAIYAFMNRDLRTAFYKLLKINTSKPAPV